MLCYEFMNVMMLWICVMGLCKLYSQLLPSSNVDPRNVLSCLPETFLSSLARSPEIEIIYLKDYTLKNKNKKD